MTGQELKQLRARLGLTQQTLADKIGVWRNTVARWETETRKIPAPVIRLLQLLEAGQNNEVALASREAGTKGDTQT